jgi:hypothetical protein
MDTHAVRSALLKELGSVADRPQLERFFKQSTRADVDALLDAFAELQLGSNGQPLAGAVGNLVASFTKRKRGQASASAASPAYEDGGSDQDMGDSKDGPPTKRPRRSDDPGPGLDDALGDMLAAQVALAVSNNDVGMSRLLRRQYPQLGSFVRRNSKWRRDIGRVAEMANAPMLREIRVGYGLDYGDLPYLFQEFGDKGSVAILRELHFGYRVPLLDLRPVDRMNDVITMGNVDGMKGTKELFDITPNLQFMERALTRTGGVPALRELQNIFKFTAASVKGGIRDGTHNLLASAMRVGNIEQLEYLRTTFDLGPRDLRITFRNSALMDRRNPARVSTFYGWIFTNPQLLPAFRTTWGARGNDLFPPSWHRNASMYLYLAATEFKDDAPRGRPDPNLRFSRYIAASREMVGEFGVNVWERLGWERFLKLVPAGNPKRLEFFRAMREAKLLDRARPPYALLREIVFASKTVEMVEEMHLHWGVRTVNMDGYGRRESMRYRGDTPEDRAMRYIVFNMGYDIAGVTEDLSEDAIILDAINYLNEGYRSRRSLPFPDRYYDVIHDDAGPVEYDAKGLIKEPGDAKTTNRMLHASLADPVIFRALLDAYVLRGLVVRDPRVREHRWYKAVQRQVSDAVRAGILEGPGTYLPTGVAEIIGTLAMPAKPTATTELSVNGS